MRWAGILAINTRSHFSTLSVFSLFDWTTISAGAPDALAVIEKVVGIPDLLDLQKSIVAVPIVPGTKSQYI